MVEQFKGDLSELEASVGRSASRPKQARTPLQWPELQGSLPPNRQWRIKNWLSTGTTLLAGSGGVGKTLVAQTIATALALGRPYLEAVEKPCTVLFWACEDDRDELWRRQVDICSYFGASLKDLDEALIIEPRLGRDNTLLYQDRGTTHFTWQFDELKSQINDYKADVVFLDNIGQMFAGNENDRHQVTSFVNGISGLKADASIVLLGHPAKANGSEFSGSSAWENCVRMRWFLSSKMPDAPEDDETEEDADARYISKRKTNYTVKDFRKLIYDKGVLAPEKGVGEFVRRFSSDELNQAAENVILKAVDRCVASTIRTTDSRNSPDYLPRRMVEMHLAEGLSKKELADALSRLRLAGKLVEGPIGKYTNRAIKIGLLRGV